MKGGARFLLGALIGLCLGYGVVLLRRPGRTGPRRRTTALYIAGQRRASSREKQRVA